MTSWTALDARPTPAWFNQARLGIFVHWGLYSVPAWAPRRSEVASTGGAYAEWYGWAMHQPGNPFQKFHQQRFQGRPYANFAGDFRGELFDPARWAELFKASGAGYVTLTAKHHDGFCLWPSAQAPRWNSVECGPQRDVVGDLAHAVRDAGLRFGVYCSLYEWEHPLYRRDPAAFARQHLHLQLRDLVERYRPSHLFVDGEWEQDSTTWDSAAFLEWLTTASPVADEIAFNDRWGKDCRSVHGGYFSTEYGKVDEHGTIALPAGRAFEECRGIGHSFGFNRNEDARDYLSGHELVALLADTAARGGNLLLNVGPAADGTIPAVMDDRLRHLGRWMDLHGAAVRGTIRWRTAGSGQIRYTAAAVGEVFAICLQGRGHVLLPEVQSASEITLLADNRPLTTRPSDAGLVVTLPNDAPEDPVIRLRNPI